MNQNFIKKRHFWNDFDISSLVESLKNDEISIVGTDTILGFLANTTKRSFENLNNIKEGRSEKPYLILIGNTFNIYKFVDESCISKNLLAMISKCWPGPVTIVFKAKSDLPEFLKSKKGTIALRFPKHEGLTKVLASFDGLFSTSANKTVMPAPSRFEEIDLDVLTKVKFVIDNLEQSGDIFQNVSNLPSTILDCCEHGKVKVVRKGLYPIEELEKFYGGKFEK